MTTIRTPRRFQQATVAFTAILIMAGEWRSLAAEDVQPVPFRVERSVPLTQDAGEFLWFHPRAVVYPAGEKPTDLQAVITLQKHLYTSDHYSGLSIMHSGDGGTTWTLPDPRPELDWVAESPEVDIAVCDVTPGWHPQSKKVIAVGCQVRYSKAGAQLDDKPRTQQTSYAVFDPTDGSWTQWKTVDMPEEEIFSFVRSACAQWVAEDDGTILLPCYIGINATAPTAITVVRCRFDGNELTYDSHGTIHRLDEKRGLHEPSVIRFGERYYMTIRHDAGAYVTVSDDGLHYEEMRPWRFDDDTELGSYNTQAHWLTLGDGLFLAYTRRGDDNDHIFRHRAPLFVAQVDPERLQVMRDTEQVVVGEQGAMLGNFVPAASVRANPGSRSPNMLRTTSRDAAERKAHCSWLASLPKTNHRRPRRRTRPNSCGPAGRPARIVCFGDSVTGVYYHTGSRRAYTDMLGIGLDRVFPRSDLTMINAGISGNTTTAGSARIEQDVLDHKPTLVTVMFGLNDMTRVPLEEYRANLETIVDKCRDVGAEVVLCTPNAVIDTSGRPTAKLIEYCEVVRAVGRDRDVAICDCYQTEDEWRDQIPKDGGSR